MTRSILRTTCFLMLLLACGCDHAGDAEGPAISAAQREFINICRDYQKRYAAFNAEMKELEADERVAYAVAHHPGETNVTRMIDFEKAHRGTQAGLMATFELVTNATSTQRTDGRQWRGRHAVLPTLHVYAGMEEIAQLLRYLDGGGYDRACEAALRRLIAAPETDSAGRVRAELCLARVLQMPATRARFLTPALAGFRDGSLNDPEGMAPHIEVRLASLPAEAERDAMAREGRALLKTIAEGGSEAVWPAGRRLDYRYAQGTDPFAKDETPRVRDIAAGELFRFSHLREGRPAPDLQVELLDGTPWTLADQLGRVVVIQFSFRGCGPCERMYPTLRELRETHGDRLAVLTVMADADRSDTEAAKRSGKLPWAVHWDGARGPLATQWAVESFPTVYIVGPDGTVGPEGLRDDGLVAEVGRLAAEADLIP